MKKTIVFLWLSILAMPLFSYTWIPFCPDSIPAENICFGVGSWKGVICSPDGMYLWEEDIEEWGFYTNCGLPAFFVPMNPDTTDEIQILPLYPGMFNGKILDHATNYSMLILRQFNPQTFILHFIVPFFLYTAGFPYLIRPVLKAYQV